MRAHSAWMASRRGEAYERQAARGVMGKEILIRQGVNVKIEDEIKRIKDTFSSIRERDNRSVLFAHLIRLFNAVKKHLNNTVRNEITLHMLLIAEKIEKTVGTLLKKTEINKIGNVSYAQTAYWGAATPIIKHL